MFLWQCCCAATLLSGFWESFLIFKRVKCTVVHKPPASARLRARACVLRSPPSCLRIDGADISSQMSNKLGTSRAGLSGSVLWVCAQVHVCLGSVTQMYLSNLWGLWTILATFCSFYSPNCSVLGVKSICRALAVVYCNTSLIVFCPLLVRLLFHFSFWKCKPIFL